MAADYSICLGTAGWGVWHSPDGGTSWTRHRKPFPLNSRIQALAVHPTEAHTVFAGGDTGLFASHDGGAHWQRIGADGALPTIWSLAIDPVDPDIFFAGTRPAALYRSRDGGRQWQKLPVDIARQCSIGTPFVTGVVVDPDDHRVVWAGVEIDGVFRSRDGGDSWTHLDGGLYDPDIHAVAIAATEPKRLYASTAREMFISSDLGDTWEPLGIKQKWPLPYARGMIVKADDPAVLFAGCGETTTGEKGHVLRTRNFGETWEILPFPKEPNATMWGLATHPADPGRIVAFSLFGEVYVTEDSGASWHKIAREFGEIRAAAWLPN
ncbi:MAG: WD40/YVTN/BNR-like repeat-containing protein [Stellaceae bacterium]